MNRAKVKTTDDQHEFFAVGPHCWGRGKDRKTARANARANFPGHLIYKPERIIVTIVPKGSNIDDFGSIHFPGHNPRECEVCDLSELDAHNAKKEKRA